jgi:hypothetical protein
MKKKKNHSQINDKSSTSIWLKTKMEAQKRHWRRDASYMKGHNGLERNDIKQLVHGVDTSFCYLHNPKVQIMVLFQNKSEKGSI